MPLNIAVCVKRVPDTAADKNLDPTDFTLERNPDESILTPVDEVAVEEALRLKEANGGEVTVVTTGPEAALTKAAEGRCPWAATRRSTCPTPCSTGPMPRRSPMRWPVSCATL